MQTGERWEVDYSRQHVTSAERPRGRHPSSTVHPDDVQPAPGGASSISPISDFTAAQTVSDVLPGRAPHLLPSVAQWRGPASSACRPPFTPRQERGPPRALVTRGSPAWGPARGSSTA
jgi:hypothetical protein